MASAGVVRFRRRSAPKPVNYSTPIYTQRYAPELEKRSAWYRSRLSFSWRVDETYIRVKGRLKYLYRAIAERDPAPTGEVSQQPPRM